MTATIEQIFKAALAIGRTTDSHPLHGISFDGNLEDGHLDRAAAEPDLTQDERDCLELLRPLTARERKAAYECADWALLIERRIVESPALEAANMIGLARQSKSWGEQPHQIKATLREYFPDAHADIIDDVLRDL